MEQFEGKLYSNPRVAPPMLSLEDIHVDDSSRDIPIGSILFYSKRKALPGKKESIVLQVMASYREC